MANKYGFAGRLDYYALQGVRFGISGYYGRSMHNTFPNDKEGEGKTYDKVKGIVAVGAFDLTFNRANWIVRANADYGYLSDAAKISEAKINATASGSPAKKSRVGKNAVALGIEAGYDVFSQFVKLRNNRQKFYLSDVTSITTPIYLNTVNQNIPIPTATVLPRVSTTIHSHK